MASAGLTPRVRLMAVCDGVRESKREASVFHLKGVRQDIAAKAFPFVPARLWLFLVLSSPRPGRYPCCVRVINERTDKAIFYAHVEPSPTFDAAREWQIARARINCVFPEPGRYTFQVHFFQEQGSDLLKGELPFTLLKEGD